MSFAGQAGVEGSPIGFLTLGGHRRTATSVVCQRWQPTVRGHVSCCCVAMCVPYHPVHVRPIERGGVGNRLGEHGAVRVVRARKGAVQCVGRPQGRKTQPPDRRRKRLHGTRLLVERHGLHQCSGTCDGGGGVVAPAETHRATVNKRHPFQVARVEPVKLYGGLWRWRWRRWWRGWWWGWATAVHREHQHGVGTPACFAAGARAGCRARFRHLWRVVECIPAVTLPAELNPCQLLARVLALLCALLLCHALAVGCRGCRQTEWPVDMPACRVVHVASSVLQIHRARPDGGGTV